MRDFVFEFFNGRVIYYCWGLKTRIFVADVMRFFWVSWLIVWNSGLDTNS